jgi:hypothetical protein
MKHPILVSIKPAAAQISILGVGGLMEAIRA